jgi:hypothetical protein
MYKEKYLKYKTKYLELKNQLGGTIEYIEDINKQIDATDIEYKQYIKLHDTLKYQIDTYKPKSQEEYRQHDANKKRLIDIIRKMNKKSTELKKLIESRELEEYNNLKREYESKNVPISKSSTLSSEQQQSQSIDDQIKEAWDNYKYSQEITKFASERLKEIASKQEKEAYFNWKKLHDTLGDYLDRKNIYLGNYIMNDATGKYELKKP